MTTPILVALALAGWSMSTFASEKPNCDPAMGLIDGSCPAAATPVLKFSVSPEEHWFGFQGHPIGCHKNGKWNDCGFAQAARLFETQGGVDDQLKAQADYWATKFRKGRKLQAVTENGDATTITVEKTTPAIDLGGFWLHEKVGNTTLPELRVLYWTGALKVQFIPKIETSIDQSTISLWRTEIRAIVDRALPLKCCGPDDRERFVKYEILPPKVMSPRRFSNIVVAQFPVHFHQRVPPGAAPGTVDKQAEKSGIYVDDRGLATVIHNKTNNKTLRLTFGHPEWSDTATELLLLDPVMFFQVEGDNRPYMLSEWSESWESNGAVIIDLTTGKAAAH